MRANLCLSFAAAGLFLAARAYAGVIYAAVDLPTLGPNGGDLWQYNYTFSNFTPQQNVAIEILFDPLLYTSLENPPPPVSGWSVQSLEPDPDFTDPGRFSALALQDNASLAGPFSITFVWLGTGTPGPQPVEINQFDSLGAFVSTLATDETSPVPEPATALLAGFAFLAFAFYLRLLAQMKSSRAENTATSSRRISRRIPTGLRRHI